MESIHQTWGCRLLSLPTWTANVHNRSHVHGSSLAQQEWWIVQEWTHWPECVGHIWVEETAVCSMSVVSPQQSFQVLFMGSVVSLFVCSSLGFFRTVLEKISKPGRYCGRPTTTVVVCQLPIISLKMFYVFINLFGRLPVALSAVVPPSLSSLWSSSSAEPLRRAWTSSSSPLLMSTSLLLLHLPKTPNHSSTFSTQPRPFRSLQSLRTLFRRNFGMGEFFLR